MKIRTAFVSNSSSSSFVIVTTKEKWNEARVKLRESLGSKRTRVIIEEHGQGKKVKILGHPALVFQGVIGSEEFGSSVIEDMIDDGSITEDEADELSCEAYSELGELERILNDDGVSYYSSTGC